MQCALYASTVVRGKLADPFDHKGDIVLVDLFATDEDLSSWKACLRGRSEVDDDLQQVINLCLFTQGLAYVVRQHIKECVQIIRYYLSQTFPYQPLEASRSC